MQSTTEAIKYYCIKKEKYLVYYASNGKKGALIKQIKDFFKKYRLPTSESTANFGMYAGNQKRPNLSTWPYCLSSVF